MRCSTAALVGLLLLVQLDTGGAENQSDAVFAAMDAHGRHWVGHNATVREKLNNSRSIFVGSGERLAEELISANIFRLKAPIVYDVGSLDGDACSMREYGDSLT
jgi:hypothetical protein